MADFFIDLTGTWWGVFVISTAAVAVWFALSAVFYRLFFKRLYDLLLSGAALVLLSPLLLTLWILVRAKLGKPAVFPQPRPGKKGKIFVLHKFRTMTEERDADGKLLPDAVRLTSFGKTLRALSLDEFPELWDIFRGKMSFIGPRPQLIKDLVFMDSETGARHNVRPGLSGLAQVSGRNSLEWDERLRYDLKYAKRVNIFSDIAIFFKTFLTVLRRSDIATAGMATSEDYGDWLLRTDQITSEEYDAAIAKSKAMREEYLSKNDKRA